MRERCFVIKSNLKKTFTMEFSVGSTALHQEMHLISYVLLTLVMLNKLRCHVHF